MKIELDASLSAHQNASKYYDEAKERKKKAQSIRDAILDVEKRAEREKRRAEFAAVAAAEEQKRGEKSIKVLSGRKREWFEKFHWFKTTNGFLVVSGKDASQNEAVVAKHAEKNDFFFHADIQGAAVTILQTKAAPESVPKEDCEEAAQFAASYSSAWKKMLGSVDVYRVLVSQLSKKSHGEFVSKGSFVMKGSREWYKNAELGLKIGFDEAGLLISLPAKCGRKLQKEVQLKPGTASQNQASKKLAEKFEVKDTGEVLSLLPGPVDLE